MAAAGTWRSRGWDLRDAGAKATVLGDAVGEQRGEPLELRWESSSESGASSKAAFPSPWEAGQPSAAAALLERCVKAGVVSQKTLDLTRRNDPCFVKFSEMEKMANIRAEINEKKLKAEMLQLEKETADIAHPFYLGKKCEILQDMNRHLEAVLKEKRTLRKMLIKPRCQESLPIEATCHKYVVELLAEAVTFIDNLESHLQTVRSIPQIPSIMKNMVSSKRTEPSVSPSIKNSMLFDCLGYFYVLL
uniref:HAUS augmin like complex subunit 2 n=1 Tax=Calidris pygmaea TaxID=425635 RepID=A0A8C3KEE1_9CHAR